jgi:hypothetical protein
MHYLIESPYMDGSKPCRFKLICYEVSSYSPNSNYGRAELTGVTYKLVDNKLVKGKTSITNFPTWLAPNHTLFDTPEAALDEKLTRTARVISTFTRDAKRKIDLWQSALDRNNTLLAEIASNRPELLL